MKKIRIKKFNLKQLFLGIAAISILPLILLSIGMLIGMNANPGALLYCITSILLGPILYGLVGMLFGLGYNWFSPKIGQFEIEIEIDVVEKEE